MTLRRPPNVCCLPPVRSARKYSRAVFLVSLLAALGGHSIAEPRASRAEPDSIRVAVLDSAGTQRIGIRGLLASLKMPFIVNDTTGKLEFLAGKYLVRLTGRNPFIVLTERQSNIESISQTTVQTVRSGGEFFAPPEEFLSLLNRVWDRSASFNRDNGFVCFRKGRPASFDITGLGMERRLNGYLLTIVASRKLQDVESWLKPDGWLFVTVANATADSAALLRFKPTGVLRKVFVFQSPTSVQLTFQLSTDVQQAEVGNDPSSNSLLVSLRTRPGAPTIVHPRGGDEANPDLANERKRWKLDVIVIDAGHGGKDPGALGVSGVREKDVTLAVALKLGKLIEGSMKGVKVVYTRKNDKFVELYRRTQIANEASGKLFISLHCNSMPKKPSRQNGFEIYLLRPGRTEEAIEIAARENAVIQFEEGYEERYKKLTEEEFIMVTMAQSSYVKSSEQFAEISSRTMARQLNIRNSGVHQAGFYVLVGASMPNVLVEMGYLSNKKEEQVLKGKAGQDRIAHSILEGIREYMGTYEKALRTGGEKGSL